MGQPFSVHIIHRKHVVVCLDAGAKYFQNRNGWCKELSEMRLWVLMGKKKYRPFMKALRKLRKPSGRVYYFFCWKRKRISFEARYNYIENMIVALIIVQQWLPQTAVWDNLAAFRRYQYCCIFVCDNCCICFFNCNSCCIRSSCSSSDSCCIGCCCCGRAVATVLAAVGSINVVAVAVICYRCYCLCCCYFYCWCCFRCCYWSFFAVIVFSTGLFFWKGFASIHESFNFSIFH